MNKSILLMILAGLQAATPVLAESSRLGRFAEYHVGPYDLVTFSREAALVRLCEGCTPRRLSIDNDTALFEQERPIVLKRATELYLSKPYRQVFIGLDRQLDRIDYIRFGGHSDEQGE